MKDDLKGFPTREDPKGFATKEDLYRVAWLQGGAIVAAMAALLSMGRFI